MEVCGSKMQARMRVIPQKIECKVSEISVLLKAKVGGTPNGLITVKVDPPINGTALEALLKAKDLEIEDGRLLSFK